MCNSFSRLYFFSFNQKVAKLIGKKTFGSNFASGCGKKIYLYTFSGCNYIKSWGPVSFCGWSDPLRHSRTHYQSIARNATAAKFRKQFIRACLFIEWESSRARFSTFLSGVAEYPGESERWRARASSVSASVTCGPPEMHFGCQRFCVRGLNSILGRRK